MESPGGPTAEIGIGYPCCRATYYIPVQPGSEIDPVTVAQLADFAHTAEHPGCVDELENGGLTVEAAP